MTNRRETDDLAPAVMPILRGSPADVEDLLHAVGAEPRVLGDSIRCRAWYRDGDGLDAVSFTVNGTWHAHDFVDESLSSETIIGRLLAGTKYEPNGSTPTVKVEPDPLPPLPRRLELLDAIKRADELPHVAADLTALGWRGHEAKLAAPPLHVGHDGQKIVIPVRDAEGVLLDTLTFRVGQKIRAGRSRRRDLYPAPEQIAGRDILLVEGEKDAVTATLAGFDAVGIPGVSWAAKAAPERFRGKRVTIVMDCDDEGRNAAEKIFKTFATAGIEHVVVDLDPSRNDGFDLSDLAAEIGLEAAAVRVRELAAGCQVSGVRCQAGCRGCPRHPKGGCRAPSRRHRGSRGKWRFLSALFFARSFRGSAAARGHR